MTTRIMLVFAGALVLAGLAPPAGAEDESAAKKATMTAKEALKRLKDGNKRFAEDKPAARGSFLADHAKLAAGQRPFAVVLACADSRVAPELMFDQSLGRLFVVRVAGNVASPMVEASVEYAVAYLKCPLVVVLGHEQCGAVEAALGDKKKYKGRLAELLNRIHVGDNPAGDKKPALPNAVRANARYQARQLVRESTVLRDFSTSGRIEVVSAVYSLKTGVVTWLKPAATPKD